MNKKSIKLASLCIVIGLVFLSGCFYNPELKINCTMNGFGSGECSFTNVNNYLSSAACIKIELYRVNVGLVSSSSAICSGEVGRMETKTVSFSLPDVSEKCTPDYNSNQSWADICNFTVAGL